MERESLLQPPSQPSSSSHTGQTEIRIEEREAMFYNESERNLDDFITQGRSALQNLVEQRHLLKSTQRKMLDAANTLGLSRTVIHFIERRSTQDKWIFFACCLLSVIGMWIVIHFFT